LQSDRPEVTIITGVGSVAVDDIRSQLGDREADVVLDVVRVAITRPEEVRKALAEATAAQLVVITRGGGESVQVLDDEALIAAVTASPVPVAVALGHATDDLVRGMPVIRQVPSGSRSAQPVSYSA
jgi:exodeoxyribonuclease VII large subunit